MKQEKTGAAITFVIGTLSVTLKSAWTVKLRRGGQEAKDGKREHVLLPRDN